MPVPRISIPRTELRQLHSDIMDDDYQLYVGLPSTYSDESKKYPVLYFVDGSVGAVLTIPIYQQLEMGQDAAEMILVGIGYPTEDLDTWAERRMQELRPERQGKAFTRAILEEIIPFTEQEYRTSGLRAFAGYSAGGLFGMHLLLNQTESFAYYALGSPAFLVASTEEGQAAELWRTGPSFDEEEEYAGTHRDLNARVQITYGEEENDRIVQPTREMIRILRERDYPNLTLETIPFPGETHMSCVGPWMSRYLRFLFR